MKDNKRKTLSGNGGRYIFAAVTGIYLITCAAIFVYLDRKEAEAYVRPIHVSETAESFPADSSDETIDLNTASAEELMTLDGIGRELAERIIEYREKNNGFLTVDELLNVNGIGKAKLEKLRKSVRV